MSSTGVFNLIKDNVWLDTPQISGVNLEDIREKVKNVPVHKLNLLTSQLNSIIERTNKNDEDYDVIFGIGKIFAEVLFGAIVIFETLNINPIDLSYNDFERIRQQRLILNPEKVLEEKNDFEGEVDHVRQEILFKLASLTDSIRILEEKFDQEEVFNCNVSRFNIRIFNVLRKRYLKSKDLSQEELLMIEEIANEVLLIMELEIAECFLERQNGLEKVRSSLTDCFDMLKHLLEKLESCKNREVLSEIKQAAASVVLNPKIILESFNFRDICKILFNFFVLKVDERLEKRRLQPISTKIQFSREQEFLNSLSEFKKYIRSDLPDVKKYLPQKVPNL
ncbi:MAG: hypothetical protein LBJ09_03815 [Clostridiales bacterium]|jgi:hypothetical protein|nr:hypothetical protein [Clostridiales bacterium]